MRFILITLVAFLLMETTPEEARKANEAYDNGDYEKAITLFKKAIDADPDNSKLFYNLASAQAKAGKSEEAIRTFEQFKNMTDDAERRAMADYDIGNILAEAKQWDRALEYYKKSMRYLTSDEDAKHNYELAKQKKKEQKNKNENKNQNQQQQQNQNQDQQKQKQQQQNQNQQNQQNQNQQNQNQQSQQNQQKKQNQQGQQQQPQQSKINKAEAEKILKALEQKEKELLQEFKKQKMKSSKNTNEKDW